MNLSFLRSIFLLCVLLTCLSNSVSATAIDNLKLFIQQTQTVQAHFSQALADRNTRIIQRSSGIMQFERPDKFRWIYKTPYEQSIIGDGEKVWFYDHDLNQVTVRQFNIAIGSSPAALLAGSGTIEENFELVNLGKQEDIEWLEATPKNKDSTFEFIQMGFSQQGELQFMALRDNFGQTTYLTFSELNKNPKLPDDAFRFVPPEGVDIISE
ncbi:MAG: outer membrane lipoprotein chaperone LolA [Nitrosomonas sp.]|jgi:outer membrane lipoprotein carrier protein|nr:outer membrane lipoprotein chaperone LolA [Burkholderiales bacterium]MDR4520854.1 outer membrane lipoprotein chaperone LolA [Nitrosomonas sp.]HQU62898.1 outer membrane lipoprotein chaperone LolA [Nitrosomonas sp.]